MAKKIADAIIELQALAGEMKGIRQAPDTPPDRMSQYPFAIAYPGTGEIVKNTGWKKGLHTIILEIHTSRKNMARDVAMMVDYEDTLTDSLLANANISLNSTVDTINAIRYQFGALGYDSVETIGYRFEIDVKIEDTV